MPSTPRQLNRDWRPTRVWMYLRQNRLTALSPEMKRLERSASSALALCHGRIDVNIGVAVRSAEAAGFSGSLWLVVSH